jgi:protein O-GlcNAc transferase
VPVVSLFGDTWASRAGKSVLTTVGLPDLIAGSEQDYIDKAVALARDADARATLRRSMRARMESSPLLDVAQFTRGLEQIYLAAWQAWTS